MEKRQKYKTTFSSTYLLFHWFWPLMTVTIFQTSTVSFHLQHQDAELFPCRQEFQEPALSEWHLLSILNPACHQTLNFLLLLTSWRCVFLNNIGVWWPQMTGLHYVFCSAVNHTCCFMGKFAIIFLVCGTAWLIIMCYFKVCACWLNLKLKLKIKWLWFFLSWFSEVCSLETAVCSQQGDFDLTRLKHIDSWLLFSNTMLPISIILFLCRWLNMLVFLNAHIN